MHRSVYPFWRALLGRDARMRLRLARSLTAGVVYAFSMAAQWQAVRLGLADAMAAGVLTAFVSLGVTASYLGIRSGLSLRLQDPALTVPQMVFALLSLALAYLINPPMRAILMMVVALVLVFGAFTLAPSQCRGLGWFAVALFGLAMAAGATLDPQRFPPVIETFHFLYTAIVLPTLARLAGQLSRLRADRRQKRVELQDAMRRLQQLATHDELTGLPNRRHLQHWVLHEFARSRRTGAELCVALIDLDHFKRINDLHGHAVGDAVLRIFARAARDVLRDVDVLARWGGEEFLLVMPDTAMDEAELSLQRLRDHLAGADPWRACPQGQVTFSAGLTRYQAPQTLDDAAAQADRALYEAKGQGRDRVVRG